jgi:hypothetical protein
LEQKVWRDDAVFRDFAELLRRRLELGVYGSEDSVRYMLFAALVQHGVAPERVVMEYPHPGLEKKEIDTVVVGDDLQPVLVIECKYDRAIPGGRNKPRTQAAGGLFKDMGRLAILEWPADRYFVYLTDKEMYAHLRSPRNGLLEIFDLAVGSALELTTQYFQGRAQTFMNRMGAWPGRIAIRSVVAANLPRDHYLRVYEVGQVT